MASVDNMQYTHEDKVTAAIFVFQCYGRCPRLFGPRYRGGTNIETIPVESWEEILEAYNDLAYC